MTRALRLTFAFSIAAAISAPLEAQDLTVVSKISMGERSGTQTQYLTSKKSRTTDGQNDTIMEYATGRFVFIDHTKKQYWETSMAEMAAYFDKIEGELKGNPMFDSMFGGPDAVKVERDKGSRKIAGYDCDNYTMSMGTSFVFELCAAKGLQPPPQYFEARKFSYASMGPMGKRYAKMFEEMKKISGFPLSLAMNSDMGMMKQHILTEATEVRKGAVPDSAFEIPAGYSKKPSPFNR
ncbi:MAG TPA: DUF4412 domain-containing protein [Thermoanaerobaculia bacterium]|jgi:hypothetical protein|nr:DUF4412 domain-containing protein [Thermoanaerobaculia bacterium]